MLSQPAKNARQGGLGNHGKRRDRRVQMPMEGCQAEVVPHFAK